MILQDPKFDSISRLQTTLLRNFSPLPKASFNVAFDLSIFLLTILSEAGKMPDFMSLPTELWSRLDYASDTLNMLNE